MQARERRGTIAKATENQTFFSPSFIIIEEDRRLVVDLSIIDMKIPCDDYPVEGDSPIDKPRRWRLMV